MFLQAPESEHAETEKSGSVVASCAFARMKLLCPYCKKIFTEMNNSQCPHCGKTLLLPASLRKTDRAARLRRHHQLERLYKRVEAESSPPFLSLLGRKPTHIVIILAALVFIGAALIRNVTRKVERPEEQTAIDELTALRIALDRFYRDCGRYPTTEEGLKTLVLSPGDKTWGGPYVNLVKPDPWLEVYRYRFESNAVHLRSCGPDHTFGTTDDLFPRVGGRSE